MGRNATYCKVKATKHLLNVPTGAKPAEDTRFANLKGCSSFLPLSLAEQKHHI
jgi:hypothetical protein